MKVKAVFESGSSVLELHADTDQERKMLEVFGIGRGGVKADVKIERDSYMRTTSVYVQISPVLEALA